MPYRHPGLGSFPLLILVFSLCAVATAAQSPSAPSNEILEFKKPIEREISSGEKHVYRVSLDGDEFAIFTIEQMGIDVEEFIIDKAGKVVADADTAPRNDGADRISLVVMTPGEHTFEVRPKFRGEKGKYRITFSERRPSTDRDRALYEADTIYIEFLRLYSAGKYKEALDALERVLPIREKFSDPASGEVGIVLGRMGMVHYYLGDNEKGQEYLTKALNYFELHPPSEQILVSFALTNAGNISYFRGDLVEAERMYQRSLEIKEKELGPINNTVALTLSNLGSIYRMRGDYPNAETTYLRSLEIREKVRGKDHVDLRETLLNLAAVNIARGDYESALAYDRRVLDIVTKALGPDHPDTGTALATVAKVYLELGDLAKAEDLLSRGLETMRKSLKDENNYIISALSDLGRVYKGNGDVDKAKAYFEEALGLAEKNSASMPLRLGEYLHDYGSFLLEQGELENAEKHLTRAFQIRQSILGDNNPSVGRTASMLARLYALKRDLPSAVTFQSRAIAAAELNIGLNLSTGTERQKLGYLEYLANDLSQAVAINAMLDKADTAGRDLALTAILQRKGRVLDAMANSTASLRQRSSPEVRNLFERLNDTNALISQLIIDGPRNPADTNYQKRLDELRQRQARYEAELSRQTSGSFQGTRALSVAEVKDLLPKDAALVEFAVFSPLTGKTPEDERYAAFILRKNAPTEWVDLGPRAVIDRMADSLRNSMRQQSRPDVRKLAREIDKAVMQPIRSLAGEPTRFLLSTEGSLSLVPFEAFYDETGRFLIERYSITYISSARDLRRLADSRSAGNTPMVIANPDFGETLAEADGQASDIGSEDRRRSVTNTRDLAETYFAPLSGSEAEGRSIVQIFPNAKLISGADATETALKDAVSPGILHIATHGFFLFDPDDVAGSRGSRTSTKPSVTVRDNPLLRSGLAFAGANRRSGDKDDGILTALEASGLNLWGTRLVVLSACDTGLGEIRNREGVYGLRRSFAIAGAESLVMSLWPVSDRVTRELMTGYYKNLKAGMGRGEALRQVQLAMLKDPGRRHPFYWANFIQSGEWASLDGKR